MISDAHDLDAAAVLTAAEGLTSEQRRQAVDELLLVLQWADLHGDDPVEGRALGSDQLVDYGGEGTPLVRELCWAELAIARQAGLASTRHLAADALDLRHRLPLVWQAVLDLRLPAWVARKVAAMSRTLSRDAVTLVDVAVAAAVDQSPGRVLSIAEAKVIEADPDAHRARLAEVADAIHDQLPKDERDQVTRGELQVKAIELLSNPQAAAAFLDTVNDVTEGDTPAPLPKPKKRPATLYVFLSDLVLGGRVDGVARVEGIGPVLLEQVAELLEHREVTVQPVIDLNHTHAVSGYEHPTAVKHRTLLRTLGDVFPHSANQGYRRLDHDHPTPYVSPDQGGPPGQTGDHADAPLTRTHHRVKTHQPGYQLSQLALGAYRWVTPHGLGRVVTPRGTARVTLIRGPDGEIMGEIYDGAPIRYHPRRRGRQVEDRLVVAPLRSVPLHLLVDVENDAEQPDYERGQ